MTAENEQRPIHDATRKQAALWKRYIKAKDALNRAQARVDDIRKQLAEISEDREDYVFAGPDGFMHRARVNPSVRYSGDINRLEELDPNLARLLSKRVIDSTEAGEWDRKGLIPEDAFRLGALKRTVSRALYVYPYKPQEEASDDE